jgi:hypothetical protein
MSDWETCNECGYSGPVANDNIFGAYNGEMLCATCRVDKRLEDGDYNNE